MSSMTNIARKLAILEVLATAKEPMRPSEIGELTGEPQLNTGQYLSRMADEGLVEKPDKKKPFYRITDKGRAYLENPPEGTEDGEDRSTGGRHEGKVRKEGVREKSEDTMSDIETIPSQSDLFRREGELLGVGTRKGDIRLDAIVKYVQRTANLDDLNSVWNALTEMSVANDIKKRWIKLYSQNLPNKQIPDELKEKLESGQEEKVSAEAKAGEIPPKAKRFLLVGNEIIGDPEGDLSYMQALQQRAQNLGAAPAEANTAATIIEALKVGPEMSTSLLTVLLPLLTKETPKHDDSAMLQFITAQQQGSQNQMQLMQQMLSTATEERHKAELESIKTAIATSQKPPESNEQMKLLTQQIETLRESLHQQQLTTIQEQNKSMMEQMQNQMVRLEQQIVAAAQGKSVDTKLGLMKDGIDKFATGIDAARQDAKGFASMIISKGETPVPRTPQQRQKFGAGIEKAIEKQQEAKKLADKLWGPPQG